jgi:hypothetical protein
MKPAIVAAMVVLAGCTVKQPQSSGTAVESPTMRPAQEQGQTVQDLIAAFNDQGALKKHYPQAELVATYGEVTIWRLALAPAQWNSLAALGRYSPVFGEKQGQMRALPGGVIVRLAPALRGEKADEWFRARHLAAKPLSSLPGTYVVDTPPGLAAVDLSKQLGTAPDVLHAEPNWWENYSLRK